MDYLDKIIYALSMAIEVISCLDFKLFIEKNKFRLTDIQWWNLANIEWDRFVNLKEVIDRLDTYIADFFYNEDALSDEEIDWMKQYRTFLESTYYMDILSWVKPSMFREIDRVMKEYNYDFNLWLYNNDREKKREA